MGGSIICITFNKPICENRPQRNHQVCTYLSSHTHVHGASLSGSLHAQEPVPISSMLLIIFCVPVVSRHLFAHLIRSRF